MINQNRLLCVAVVALSLCVMNGSAYADEHMDSPFCEVYVECVGCYTALYPSQAQVDTSARCKSAAEQNDPPGSIRIEYMPEEPLDPVGVQCHAQGGPALLCEAYPLPETPGEFSYAWITSTGLSPTNGLYSAWSPSRNYHCSGANQEITVLVTSPRGTVGIATIQLDCSQP